MKKVLFALVFLGLVAFGVWNWWPKVAPSSAADGADARESASSSSPAASSKPAVASLEGRVATQTEVPPLPPAALYQMKDGVFDLELSEYAGYAGLIAANGGLEPSENSYFFKNHGFKVRLTLSEEESWPALNTGRIGGSATTVDVLATYARTFHAVVPAQIGFSRGADAVVVQSDIKRINHLKGRVLITSQFTEAEFFIRYLASEAGLEVKTLVDDERPDPERVNLIFAEDSMAAGDLFIESVNSGRNDLAGAVIWGAKIEEILQKTSGKSRLLVDNRNLLVVADVLVVNRPFAQANPKIVEGLVDGLLAGNDMVRTNAAAQVDLIARTFKWTPEQTRAELERVHFSNWPENRAFFSGAIDAAGSYGGIFQSAMFAYGPLLNHSVPPERLLDLKLEPLASKYAQQQVSIQPIRSAKTETLEKNPLLTRDIRFFFQPNSSALEHNPANEKNYEAIKQLLQVSPGSTILLRGHVDNARVPEFRREGGDRKVKEMALTAMELSRQRADSVRSELARRYQLPAHRLEVVGRGWEEPAGTDSEKNRRVEVQWFTVE